MKKLLLTTALAAFLMKSCNRDRHDYEYIPEPPIEEPVCPPDCDCPECYVPEPPQLDPRTVEFSRFHLVNPTGALAEWSTFPEFKSNIMYYYNDTTVGHIYLKPYATDNWMGAPINLVTELIDQLHIARNINPNRTLPHPESAPLMPFDIYRADSTRLVNLGFRLSEYSTVR